MNDTAGIGVEMVHEATREAVRLLAVLDGTVVERCAEAGCEVCASSVRRAA